jgi:hypothetical protein
MNKKGVNAGVFAGRIGKGLVLLFLRTRSALECESEVYPRIGR